MRLQAGGAIVRGYPQTGFLMIFYLRYLLIAALALFLLTVSLANRVIVPVNFLPEDLAALFGMNLSVEIPLFLVIFSGVACGVVIGFTCEWLREHKYRRTVSIRGRELMRLERELAVMKKDTDVPHKDDVLALIEGPRKAG